MGEQEHREGKLMGHSHPAASVRTEPELTPPGCFSRAVGRFPHVKFPDVKII